MWALICRFCFLILVFGLVSGQLSVDFYKNTCPNLEIIVRKAMIKKYQQTPVAAAGTLRVFFHDCMVEGCDGSVLVASTENNKAEKDADINLSLPGDGFDAVNRAKDAVEAQCPGVVSCADLLALITRDFVGLIGGPRWEVKKGRRDGKISQASRVNGNLPLPTMSVDQIIQLFASKGFNMTDMVALIGAHTAGFAHCNQFMDRIYNWQGTNKIDPTMNPNYAAGLRLTCPQVGLDPTVVANLDVTTPKIFDNVFYQNTQKGLGLLKSDQNLFDDPRTQPIVNAFASSKTAFFNAFASAMDKLSMTGVKTGNEGEIRQICGSFNN